MSDTPQQKAVLVGFGTLLLQESLGDTIGADGAKTKRFRPVIIQNYRRLFNLLPDHYPAIVVNKLRENQSEVAAANVEPAEGITFNGLAYEVDANDLENLDKRERYYQRQEVEYSDFYTGEPLGKCFVYESDPNARWIERSVEKMLPLWRDIVYARVGAYRIGDDFGKYYDATTYLADGKTLLVDFYREHLAALLDLDAIRK